MLVDRSSDEEGKANDDIDEDGCTGGDKNLRIDFSD